MPGLNARRRIVRLAVGGRVASGPFAGMRFSTPDLYKRLGTYELEVVPLLRAIEAKCFDRIINVGAGDGYYSTGLARLFAGKVPVVAFEMASYHRGLAMLNAADNDLSAVIEVRGECTPQDFRSTVADGRHTLVVMDVEGFEVELLDPGSVTALAGCTILFETHEREMPGSADLIGARFASSHDIQRAKSRPRQPSDWPGQSTRLRVAAGLIGQTSCLAQMNEGRHGQQEWWLLTPNHR